MKQRQAPLVTDWHKHQAPNSNHCIATKCPQCGHFGCLKWHNEKNGVKRLVIHHSHYLNQNTFVQSRNYWHEVLLGVEK